MRLVHVCLVVGAADRQLTTWQVQSTDTCLHLSLCLCLLLQALSLRAQRRVRAWP